MSSVEFVQYALRSGGRRTKRPSCGCRTSLDALKADELHKIEQTTGLRYGRQELNEIDAYIARAEALLVGSDEDFHGPFVAAIRAFFGALDRS